MASPFYLDWLAYQQPKPIEWAERKFRSTIHFIDTSWSNPMSLDKSWIRVNYSEARRMGARAALLFLNEDAEPAIPQLVRYATSSKDPRLAWYAVQCLGNIGRPAHTNLFSLIRFFNTDLAAYDMKALAIRSYKVEPSNNTAAISVLTNY